ncbi:MAG: NTP transferase domain-containing protein [Polyangiaceae bacterium]
MPDVVTIVLAAGQGTRLGGPKALLLTRDGLDTRPLIEVQCRERRAAESQRVLAVLRPDTAALVGDRVRAAGGEVVISVAPDALGPAGSLAAAAAHLGADPTRAVIVTPVDIRAAPTTPPALLAALEAPASAAPLPFAVVPRFAGRKGHPVAMLPEVLARYRVPEPPPLRDHLRSLGDHLHLLDVTDPHILEDLDRPDQTDLLARFTRIPGPPRFFPA